MVTAMSGDRARTALAGTRFARIDWVDETGSTNADLLAGVAADGDVGERVLVAEHQTAGRGRLGRTWEAPPGTSLLFSVLLRPGLPVESLHLVTMAVALAASDACEAVAGVRPRLKWPNDLVVVGADGATRKLAGILAESVVRDGAVAALVVGTGINVNWPRDPAELAAIATALDHHAGSEVDREDLLVAILRGFDSILAALGEPGGAAALLMRYRHLSATLGRRVRVELASGALEGVAVDVADDGHLLVELGGEVVSVAAGDVVHLRPA